jgi:non-ribosomal peptide synthetase component F
MIDVFRLGPEDRILQLASLGFDVLLEEVLPTLAAGAALVLTEEPIGADGAELLSSVGRLGITGLELTTAYWHLWVDYLTLSGQTLPSGLRFVAMGGERAVPERVAQWRRFGVDLIHVYGLTEATVTSTACSLTADTGTSFGSRVPIGNPVGSTRVHVLDSMLRPVDVGMPGELYIGGDVLANGYAGQPALTAQRFVADPFCPSGHRIYRTGDMVSQRADGVLEYIGRSDTQVKIRGFRVEPGEIEAALNLHPGVAQVAVTAQESPVGKKLVAYVVPNKTADPEETQSSALLAFARSLLPDYMVPSAVILIDALPLSLNGKVDLRALRAAQPFRHQGLDPGI